MLGSEWKRPGVLNHFTVVRKLDGGIYPVGFTKEAAERNLKAGNTVLTYASRHVSSVMLIIVQLYSSFLLANARLHNFQMLNFCSQNLSMLM